MEMRKAGWLVGVGVLLFAACSENENIPGWDSADQLFGASPTSVRAEFGQEFQIRAYAECSNCRAIAPIVIEVTVDSANLDIVGARNASLSSVSMESSIAPARATLTFQLPTPTTPARANVTIRCAQIAKANVTVTWLDPARSTNLTQTIPVECTQPDGGPPEEVPDPKEFANGLGELIRVSRQAAAWVFAAGGVAANLGERTADMRSKFTPVGNDCERYEGISDFRSEKGADALVAETSLQKGTATFDPTQQRYVWSGLGQGAVFGTDDAVRFSWLDNTETVPAPAPFRAPDQVLSPPAGAETTLHVPPGAASTVAIFGQLTGDAGFTCRKDVAALPTNGSGDHVVRLVPAEVVEAIPDVMTRLQNVYVAQINAKRIPSFFPNRNRFFDAARVLQVPRSALDP